MYTCVCIYIYTYIHMYRFYCTYNFIGFVRDPLLGALCFVCMLVF